MCSSVMKCCNPRNIFGGIAAVGTGISIAEFGVSLYEKEVPLAVLSGIATIFFATLTGGSFKYFPEGHFGNAVSHLTSATSKIATVLTGAQGKTLTLAEVVEKLKNIDTSSDQDLKAIQTILTQAKTDLDTLTTEDNQLKDLNLQYKKLIDSFLPLLAQASTQNSKLSTTVTKVQTQLSAIDMVDLEKQTQGLTTVASELPSLIDQGKSMLIEHGNQLIQLQKELDELKENTTDLQGQIALNTRLLQQIGEERLKLEQARQEFEAAINVK